MARLQLGIDVTVEGARELSKVADSLDGAGSELDELAEHLDKAADKARELGDRVDDAAGSLRFDTATASAQRFEDSGEGLRNMVNGLGDSFSAATDESKSFGERLALGAGGIADVANGVRNFAIPALQSLAGGAIQAGVAHVTSVGRQVAAWALLGVQSLLHAAKVAAAWVIATGPVGLLVAAIVAAVALIILNWDKVVAFFQAAFKIISDALAAFGRFFKDVWDGLMDFLGGIGKAVVSIGKTLWDPIGKGFGAAIDFIKGIWNAFARWWNSIELSVPSVDVPFVGMVGGFSIGLPKLPTLASGGIVNQPTLALIGEKGPEAVIPLDRMQSPQTIIEVNVLGDLRAEDEESVANAIGRVLWTTGFAGVGAD